MFLSNLVQVPNENRVLLFKQWNFILKGSPFLTLVQGDGFDQLFQVKILIFYDFLEFVVLWEDLFANRHRVGKLVFKHRELLSQKRILFFQSTQNGTKLSIEREKPVHRVNVMVDDFVIVGSLVLWKFFSQFLYNLIQRIRLCARLDFLEKLSRIHFVLDFCELFIMRSDHNGCELN